MRLAVVVQVWTREPLDTRVKVGVYFWIPFLPVGPRDPI